VSADPRPIVWSVAGSDSGGGAGLQADLRAFEAFEVHGCTAVAALTAQNSVAVQRVEAVSTALLDEQLAALASDLRPLAIKTGLLGSVDNVRCLARWLRRLKEAGPVALVVDPVWCASTGGALADAALRQALCDELLPHTTVLTPNRAEAAWLLGQDRLRDDSAVEAAADALRALGAGSVVITGGDDGGDTARDFAATPQGAGWVSLPRVGTPHHHGTGCVFASSLAAALAHGFCEADAVVLAKLVTTRGLQLAGPAGEGAGPVRPRGDFARPGTTWPQWHSGIAAPAQAFQPIGAGRLDLYVIVDSAAWVGRVAAAGARTVQLRIKHGTPQDVSREIQAGVAAAERHGARLFVNDHWRLALQHRAHGVHLGQSDLATADLPALQQAGLRLGISTHAPWEVARAWALRPSYIACGPIHPTQTKDMPWAPQGPRNLAFWAGVLPLPVVAIGGLDLQRAAAAARCGADGVAVLSGITAAADPERMVAAYRDAISAARRAPPSPVAPWPLPTLAAGEPAP
jgi:hydroxymethylpyrimidine kinase/phosphomethylpyrimidine kinase/thiamine-phosphate diphosphorylase